MGLGERIQEAIAGSQAPGAPEGTPKTKAQIARECGVTAGALSQWLSGNTKSLKAETALALEQATGYRANWILHGKGPRKQTDPVQTWPFAKIDMARFTSLDEGDRGYVERRLIQAIEECEGALSGRAFGVVVSDQREEEHPGDPFAGRKFPHKSPGKRQA